MQSSRTMNFRLYLDSIRLIATLVRCSGSATTVHHFAYNSARTALLKPYITLSRRDPEATLPTSYIYLYKYEGVHSLSNAVLAPPILLVPKPFQCVLLTAPFSVPQKASNTLMLPLYPAMLDSCSSYQFQDQRRRVPHHHTM